MLPLSVCHIALKKVCLRSFSAWKFYSLLFYVLNGNFRQRKHIAVATVSVFVQTSAMWLRESRTEKNHYDVQRTQRRTQLGSLELSLAIRFVPFSLCFSSGDECENGCAHWRWWPEIKPLLATSCREIIFIFVQKDFWSSWISMNSAWPVFDFLFKRTSKWSFEQFLFLRNSNFCQSAAHAFKYVLVLNGKLCCFLLLMFRFICELFEKYTLKYYVRLKDEKRNNKFNQSSR